MPRPHRVHVPHGLYHVTARGNRRQVIFIEEADYFRFFKLLDRVIDDLSWRCHAYCLMPNHYHLVVETPGADLSTGMHRLNSAYSNWFNRRYELNGHLFQSRFYAVSVETDSHLLELSRYLALNPVRGGLCTRPGEWTWSSYRFVAHLTPEPRLLALERVLSYFGREPRLARDAFRAFVRDGYR
jgi:REP element-mobilizing transposase RayT